MPKRKNNNRKGNGSRIEKLERRLARFKPEKKFYDFHYSAANIGTSGVVRFVNFNKSGVEPPEQREGRQTQMLDWQIKFLITSTVDVPTSIRILLAWDTYPDGYGTPSVTDVLALANVYSPLNYSFKPRFQVIKDFELWTSNAKRTYVETYRCNLGNKITQFSADDGDNADIVKNALMVLMISNENTTPPQIAYYSRAHYFDM
jgi:hypothetical protein